jgi:hypothetical protein
MKKYTECSLVCYEGKDNLYKAYIKCPLVCYEEKKKLKNNETNVCNVMRVKTNLYKNLY